MFDSCTPTFAGLAARLGFSCDTAGGLVEFRNPLTLENWTLPVLELLIVVGALLTLWYAIVRLRRHGDPTNLTVWLGALAYLFIIEPPLYFPGAFGIAEYVDTMFAHNVFTVEFLWGRLPLYIVAIYPMMATVAFEIVRSLGVFRRYGVLAGAVCVGFVHHAFYEIFDHLGPQLRWWEWTLDNPMNQPFLDSVPIPSIVVFAALWPMSLAFCAQLFVGRLVDQGRTPSGGALAWRIPVVGVLASIGTVILPLPATVSKALTGSDFVSGVAYVAELVVVTVVAVPLLVKQWQRIRRDPAATEYRTHPVILGYAAGYLAVLTVLWVAALPAYFGGDGTVTAAGDPVGSLWYTVLCVAIAALCLAAVATTRRTAPDAGTPAPEATDVAVSPK